jgi:glycosyltransferase involved in cell wall biosynthesis
MSSLWEGLGLVFLEAMATEIPVLATRVSAVPEVIVEGETGLLVHPADVDDLAEGFLALAENKELREEFGRAGRIRVHEFFGLERMVQETLAIYRQVAGEDPQ